MTGLRLTPTRHWPEVLSGTAADGFSISTATRMAAVLEDELRSTYPINTVPDDMLESLHEVEAAALALEKTLMVFVYRMAEACGQNKPQALIHLGFGPGESINGSFCGEGGVISKVLTKITCPECTRLWNESKDRG